MNNVKSKSLHFPVSHWRDLNEEQLRKVMEFQCDDYDSPIQMRLRVFLYLSGLQIASDGADVMSQILRDCGDDFQSFSESVNTVDEFTKTETVILAPIDNSDERYIVSLDQLRGYVIAGTEWMYEDHSLIGLPFDTMTIGKHEYKMPDALLINTLYQQYTNAQHYLEAYWDAVSRADNIVKKMEERISIDPDYRPDDSVAEQIKALNDTAVDMQLGFLANMLTPIIKQGETRYDENDNPYTFFRKVPKYVAEDEEIVKEDMRQAPKWLFVLIYQQLQNNLMQFQSKFPDLFRKSEASPNHDALVAELGTINVIIEHGGYASASAVYEENAVFIFKRLDMLQEEARETKAAMAKGKKK